MRGDPKALSDKFPAKLVDSCQLFQTASFARSTPPSHGSARSTLVSRSHACLMYMAGLRDSRGLVGTLELDESPADTPMTGS